MEITKEIEGKFIKWTNTFGVVNYFYVYKFKPVNEELNDLCDIELFGFYLKDKWPYIHMYSRIMLLSMTSSFDFEEISRKEFFNVMNENNSKVINVIHRAMDNEIDENEYFEETYELPF